MTPPASPGLRPPDAGSRHPVRVLVCGYERGGTSLIAEVLRQQPDLDAGFEGGLLLGRRPGDFPTLEPYCTNLKRGWGLTDEGLAWVCSAPSWEEAYGRLRDVASRIERKGVQLLDKTPAYMEALPAVLGRLPGVACVVLVRDPRAVLWSWARRSDTDPVRWVRTHLVAACRRYLRYADGARRAMAGAEAGRILLVQYEAFCWLPRRGVDRLFTFLGLDAPPDGLRFVPAFPNVYGEGISREHIHAYREHLPPALSRRILRRTGRCRAWHW